MLERASPPGPLPTKALLLVWDSRLSPQPRPVQHHPKPQTRENQLLEHSQLQAGSRPTLHEVSSTRQIQQLEASISSCIWGEQRKKTGSVFGHWGPNGISRLVPASVKRLILAPPVGGGGVIIKSPRQPEMPGRDETPRSPFVGGSAPCPTQAGPPPPPGERRSRGVGIHPAPLPQGAATRPRDGPFLPRGLGGAVPAAPGLRAGHGCATRAGRPRY